MGTSSAASATRWMIRPATFLLIWLVVVLEACAYFAVRACIFVNERVLLRCRGRAAMARSARLAQLTTNGAPYRHWFAAAADLDRALGLSEGGLDEEGDGRVVLDLIARLRSLLYNPSSSAGGGAEGVEDSVISGSGTHRHHILRALDTRAGAALVADLRTACSPAFGCVGKESSYRFNHRGTNKELHEYHELVEQGLLHLLRSDGLWRQPASIVDSGRGNTRGDSGPASTTLGGEAGDSSDAANSVAAGALRRLRVFRDLRQSYGNTALCLSGGAANGYYHLGVVKALLHYEMLPKIVTGSSAGSLIGAAVATRTDAELAAFLALPAAELADFFQPCEGTVLDWAYSWFRTGAAIDPTPWNGKLHRLCGGDPADRTPITFLEAWRRTGRDFFVCVYDGSEQTRVLNWRTSPDVIIASAVIASSALPHVMAPQRLQVKTPDGRIVPLDGPDRYFDGSLKHDVPLEQLNKTFSLNCRYTIVSQVEPHILPFFYCPRGQPGAPELFRGGRGLRGGFFLSLAERFLKLDMQKWLSLLRDVGLSPGGVQEFDDAFLQKTWGDVTILPPIRVVDYFRVFSNPSVQSMREQVRLGQSSAWPKLCMVSHRHRIERCLARCVKEAAAAVVDSSGLSTGAVRGRDWRRWGSGEMSLRGGAGSGVDLGVVASMDVGKASTVSVHERHHLMRERDMAHALLEQERERSESLQEALDVEQMRRIKGEEEMRGLGQIMEMDTAALRRRASHHSRSPTRRSSVVLSGPQ